jgi:hypothetical protein
MGQLQTNLVPLRRNRPAGERIRRDAEMDGMFPVWSTHSAYTSGAIRPELIQASELLRSNTPESVEEAIGLLQSTVYSFSVKVCAAPFPSDHAPPS